MNVEAPPGPKPRWEWWHFLVAALLALQGLLFLVPQTRPGELGLVCWMIGGDSCIWLTLAAVVFMLAVATSLWRRPLFTFRRAIGCAMLLVLAASPMAFRIYPSSHDDSPSAVRFRVPLDGPVAVGWGGASPGVNYHVAYPDQRWAYDLLVLNEGSSFAGEGEQLEDYYCYGLPVLAPADGEVVAVFHDARDMPIGMLGGMPTGGNQIVVEVAPSQFLFLCHLQPGSIEVAPGDKIAQGQPIARVGNSGNTSEPHLHIHLQDTAEDDLGEGIPLYFHNYRTGGRIVERGIPTGGFRFGQFAGQIIEHVGDNDRGDRDAAAGEQP